MEEKTLRTIKSFRRWGYTVEGWYETQDALREMQGVYVVATDGAFGPYVLDVGESHNVRDSVQTHERAGDWEKNRVGHLYYGAIYIGFNQSQTLTDTHVRRRIEKRIRKVEQPLCGKDYVSARSQADLQTV